MATPALPFTGTELHSHLAAEEARLAPLASPTFTGTPLMPTAATGTNTTQGATTAFVQAQIASSVGTVTAFAKTLLDDSDAASVLSTLGIPQASVSLTDATTITPNFTSGRNFHVTLGGNRTLANPTNQVAGQAGRILIKQDATGSRTLAYGSHWLFPGGDPTLSTAANAVDMLCYDVQASGEIYATLIKAFS
jgi:hypothetical protein